MDRNILREKVFYSIRLFVEEIFVCFGKYGRDTVHNLADYQQSFLCVLIDFMDHRDVRFSL